MGIMDERESRPRVESIGIREIPPLREWERTTRTAVFIDGQNLSSSIDRLGLRKQGKDLDFEKLLTWLAENKREIVQASYYCVPHPDRPDYEAFLERLSRLGIRVKEVSGKIIHGQEKKGPLDTVLTADMIANSDQFDEAVLVSGDGDFAYVVNQLLAKGKKVRIIADSTNIGRELVSSRGAEITFLDKVLPQLTMERPNRRSAEIISIEKKAG